MRRSVTWIVIVGLVGLGTLCFAPAALAEWWWDSSPSTTNPGTTTDPGTTTASTPEIDMGAAAGALTIVGGALALLGERWRRK